MPKKKGKKKGGRKKAQVAAEKEEMVKKTREFLKIYQSSCARLNSSAAAMVLQSTRSCLEDERPLTKAVVDRQKASLGRASSRKKARPGVAADPLPTVITAESGASLPPISLQPLFDALMAVKYDHVKCLHVWHQPLTHDDLVALALFMEGSLGAQLRVLELVDDNLTPWEFQRICRPIATSSLVRICLDYNRLPVESISALSVAVQCNRTLTSASLNYCHLTHECGDPLGVMLVTSQIRELSLVGNLLRPVGVTSLVRPLVAVSEVNEGMPLLQKLFLQDNAIDGGGTDGAYAPVACLQVIRRWIASCRDLQVLMLADNQIGDGGARELLLGLQQRKEAGYSPLFVSLAHTVSAELFSEVLSLTVSKSKKKKGGKKKGKKK